MEENILMVKKHFMFSVSSNLEVYYRLVSDLYLEYIKAMLCTTEVLVISVAFFFSFIQVSTGQSIRTVSFRCYY